MSPTRRHDDAPTTTIDTQPPSRHDTTRNKQMNAASVPRERGGGNASSRTGPTQPGAPQGVIPIGGQPGGRSPRQNWTMLYCSYRSTFSLILGYISGVMFFAWMVGVFLWSVSMGWGLGNGLWCLVFGVFFPCGWGSVELGLCNCGISARLFCGGWSSVC